VEWLLFKDSQDRDRKEEIVNYKYEKYCAIYDNNTGDGKLKSLVVILVLFFALESFVIEAQEPDAPGEIITPGRGFPVGRFMEVSDDTIIVKQGTTARVRLTWITPKKEELMPLENYTVEIRHFANGKGEKIPIPEGINITYCVERREVKEPPYPTHIYLLINASEDAPTGVYLLDIRSAGYQIADETITFVVIDKENIRVRTTWYP